MKFKKYSIQNFQEVLRDLRAREEGLSEKEVQERIKLYGLNEIRLKETTALDILLAQFKSPFVYLLLVASLIAFFIGERIDALLIFIFIVINVLLGFFQEWRSERAIRLLKSYLPSKIRVKREKKEKTIDKKFLVPGDIVLLEAGDIVPADLRLLKSVNLLIDEEILSGESFSVTKSPEKLDQEPRDFFEAKNILFAGSAVISGKAEGLVIATGKETSFGEIAKLTTRITKESAYEKRLLAFSRMVLRLALVIIIIIYLLNLLINKFHLFERGQITNLDFSIFLIALLVSIVPEALPVVTTFSFSRGAIVLAKKKVIVKKLSAIEALGDIDVLCSDKTGTLTENKLSLEKIFSSDKNKCLLYGLLASPYLEEEVESPVTPFDSALFKTASREIRDAFKEYRLLFEIPFDPFRLKNSRLVENKNGERILLVRGAPEVILKNSSQFEGFLNEEEIKEKLREEGRSGKRVLAIAYKKFEKDEFSEADEKDLTFLGYFSFFDPLKKSAKRAIILSRKLGVKIKILTGDTKEVASSVAKTIGLIKDESEVISGEDLEKMSEEEFQKICQEFSVFARISPLMKLKILSALQKKSEVGFLGEGINDLPALKLANVAIVVREGAEISREVADIILLEKDLGVIVDGIQEGRNIFYNIQKYIKNTLASNFGNFFSIALVSLVIPFLPMLPVQILFVNLLTDFPLIAITTDRIDVEELRRPRLYQLNQIFSLIVLLALVSTFFDFSFFIVFYPYGEKILQTLWFIVSVLTEIILVFSLRTSHFFLKSTRPSFPLLSLSILIGAITIFLPFTEVGRKFFHFVTPPLSALLLIFFLLLSYFAVSELVKLIYWQRWRLKFLKNH